MILSDRDIKREITRGNISIEPFNEKNLTPNGYDLTIGEIYIDGDIKEEAEIEALKWFAIGTLEYIKLKNFSAQLWIRSSYARKGIIASFGKVDAGFEGNLTLPAFNAKEKIYLKRGERFCQIVFEKMNTQPLKPYTGKYKGQRGIKLK